MSRLKSPSPRAQRFANMIIDVHAHLNDEKLISEADAIVRDMQRDGLWAIVNASFDRASSESSVALAERYDGVFATVGTHPHDADGFTEDDAARYAELSREAKVVAIGEIGLDYFYDLSPRDVQKDVFVRQLELAVAVKLPVVLHVRDAYGDALDILKQNKNLLQNGALLHCYSGSEELSREFLKLGCVFSFGGALTFKNAKQNVETLRALPREAFMLETDCPYMTPVPYRGTTNKPANVALVARKAAEILGISVTEVEDITNRNAIAFFAPHLENPEW